MIILNVKKCFKEANNVTKIAQRQDKNGLCMIAKISKITNKIKKS